MVVLQSLAAARNAWGKELGDALLDFNNAKIVLGGLSDAGDLEDLSTLLGVREERAKGPHGPAGPACSTPGTTRGPGARCR